MIRPQKRRQHIAVFVAGIALLGYVCFLLVTNYLSAIHLQNSHLEHFCQETEKRAAELGYFFEERTGELRGLAKSREISVYFENRALELSMEYGLKFSLVPINELFRDLMQRGRMKSRPLYTQLVLTDDKGGLITGAVLSGGPLRDQHGWRRFLSSKYTNGTVMAVDGGKETVVSIAYTFRGKYAGQIVAWLNPELLNDALRPNGPSADRCSCLVAGTMRGTLVIVASSAPASRHLPDLASVVSGEPFHFVETVGDGPSRKMIGLRAPVKGTGFSLVDVITEAEVFGQIDPAQLLIRMSILALIVLGSVVFMVVLTIRSLVLSTRLQESMLREREVETQVERRTAELAQANQRLLEQTAALEQTNAELKTAQLTAYQQEKMASIGQLAAGVAHEINNPMGFIISNLGTLDKYIGRLKTFIQEQSDVIGAVAPTRQTTDLDDRRKKLKLDYTIEDAEHLLKESLDGAGRVKNIVQSLKSFSRLDEAEYKPADINAGLESTLAMVWNELKYKAEIKKEYGDIPATVCNLGQLNQVFMNLLVNAVHAIRDRGEISVKTWRDNDHIKIAVSDTGCGIPREHQDRIFEPFFTTKEVGKGTGLGLSIAYDIIKKHDGAISVESEAGKGSTFTVSLPIVEE